MLYPEPAFKEKEIKFEDLIWEDIETIKKWCALKYRRHKKGCPNTGHCDYYIQNAKDIQKTYARTILVWTEWDIVTYANERRKKFPNASEDSLRNLLYWQKSLKKKLREYITSKYPQGVQWFNAEGGGVNFFKTMQKLELPLELPKDLKTVRLIVIVNFR
jgi:predicted metal-binding protein